MKMRSTVAAAHVKEGIAPAMGEMRKEVGRFLQILKEVRGKNGEHTEEVARVDRGRVVTGVVEEGCR